jgi:glycine cleavage system H protein
MTSMLKYTKDHEWLRLDGDVATVGITTFAQEKLGDVVFVELPAVGATFKQGAAAATVESVKAASDVYAPVTGEVIDVNAKLPDQPGLVNAAPAEEGWLFKMRVADRTEVDALMDQAAYDAMIA